MYSKIFQMAVYLTIISNHYGGNNDVNDGTGF